MERKSTFNSVADLYGKIRPGYADELVADVCAFAGVQPGDSILESGCGTGQATPAFARRARRLIALDPGDDMIRVAKEKLSGFSNVDFVVSPFESWDAGSNRFKLIFAAQSWHWVRREVSFPKAADLLEPGGVLAIFGHVPGVLPGPLESVFQRIYFQRLGRVGRPPQTAYLPEGPYPTWFAESGRFEPVVHRVYAWSWTLTAEGFADYARTLSDHQMMTPEQREPLLEELQSEIAKVGGSFDWPTETHLFMAHKN